MSNKVLEKIFSVKNINTKKVITICGMKIKFKNKKLIQQEKINKLEQNISIQQEIINQLKQKISVNQKNIKELNHKIALTQKKLTYKMHKYLPKEKYPEALKEWYFERTGEILNLDNPQTFNEKIQWMKLYDSTPIKTQLADKYLIRDWVKEKIGEEYLIPLLGVYDNFDEIDFDKLPNQFVLKCNHGSGYNFIVTDKTQFCIQDARKKINTWMNEDYAFKGGFEMHYSNIPPKIIIEEYMKQEDAPLQDYKWFIFNGKPRILSITLDSYDYSKMKINYYDENFKLLPYTNGYPNFNEITQKPKNYEKMLEIIHIIGKEFAFVRVDFYDTGKNLYIGELTFTPGSGTDKFEPSIWDHKLGELLELPPMTN